VLVIPLHPLSKLLEIQDHAQNLEEQFRMGGRREVGIVSHRSVTSSDLKQERSFFRLSVSTFLQLVVAPPLISAFQDLFCLMLMMYSVVVATPKPLITQIKLSLLSMGGYSILTELFKKNNFCLTKLLMGV